jgi:hypothetical protein
VEYEAPLRWIGVLPLAGRLLYADAVDGGGGHGVAPRVGVEGNARALSGGDAQPKDARVAVSVASGHRDVRWLDPGYRRRT